MINKAQLVSTFLLKNNHILPFCLQFAPEIIQILSRILGSYLESTNPK